MRLSKAGQLDYKLADQIINWWPVYKPVRFTIHVYRYTVEPPNKGHFGSTALVLFSEVVLWWEVRAKMQFIAPSRPNIPG